MSKNFQQMKGRDNGTPFKNKKTIRNRRLIDAKENLPNAYKRDKDQSLIFELTGKAKEDNSDKPVK